VTNDIVKRADYETFLTNEGARLPFRVAAVSGATGFVGSHLVGLLRACGVAVRALVRGKSTPPFLKREHIEIVRGDVRSRDASRELVHGADVIFHTAAVVTPWVQNPAEQYEVAINGAKWLIDAARDLGVPVVCTSSIIVLDPYPPPLYVRLVDGNHYVRSKRVAMEVIGNARRRGVRVSTVIPSGIIGPGDYRPTAIGQIVLDTMARKAPPVSFRGGLYLVDIRDVAEAHVRAALAEPADYALPGEYWPLERLFRAINPRPGPLPVQIRTPTVVALGGAALLSAWSRLVTHRAPVITPAWVHYFSQASAMRYANDAHRLGLSPRSVATAVADTVSWYSR
jgi:dihydroflavonol-4-reductase